MQTQRPEQQVLPHLLHSQQQILITHRGSWKIDYHSARAVLEEGKAKECALNNGQQKHRIESLPHNDILGELRALRADPSMQRNGQMKCRFPSHLGIGSARLGVREREKERKKEKKQEKGIRKSVTCCILTLCTLHSALWVSDRRDGDKDKVSLLWKPATYPYFGRSTA